LKRLSDGLGDWAREGRPSVL